VEMEPCEEAASEGAVDSPFGPAPCFLHLLAVLFHSRAFLETPATQAAVSVF